MNSRSMYSPNTSSCPVNCSRPKNPWWMFEAVRKYLPAYAQSVVTFMSKRAKGARTPARRRALTVEVTREADKWALRA